MTDDPKTTLIIATRNKHKVEEIQSILDSRQYRFLTLNDFGEAPPIEEDGTTFAENATKKSVGLVKWLLTDSAVVVTLGEGKTFVLADDSGLEVDGLGGAPGVHSARFAALDTGAPGNSPDHENNAKLMRLLKAVPNEKRTARFRCVLALTPFPSSSSEFNAAEATAFTRIFSGACEGRITDAPSGKGGFGYDPLFIPHGYESSFAELGPKVKNELSHRAKALQELKKAL